MSDVLSQEALAELRRLDKEATPAPWHNEGVELYRGLAHSQIGNMHDVRVIVAIRNALPALLAAADHAERKLADVREILWKGLNGDESRVRIVTTVEDGKALRDLLK